MDVRGIEVTNQLRSAIRAKLLELGVRYDEELPDYILVMVVNKKSRQQMHEDLHLFLEDSTTPFVDWLHDQVLKKLQKVTVAKKKSTREFVPTVIVKQEEERRKKKSSSNTPEIKDEPNDEKSLQTKLNDNSEKNEITEEITTPKPIINELTSKSINLTENMSSSWTEKINHQMELAEPSTKKPIEKTKELVEKVDKRSRSQDESKELINNSSLEMDVSEKRLRSCINKPRITSVVSVKTRLGVTASRNKFEIHRERKELEEHKKHDEEYRKLSDKRPEKRLYEPMNRREAFKNKYNDDDALKKVKDNLKNQSNNDNKLKLAGTSGSNEKPRLESHLSNIKNRLGVSNKFKSKDNVDESKKNVKRRLGPVKSKFIALGRLGIGPVQRAKNDHFNNDDDDDDDDDDDSEVNTGPVKSRIIAVKKPLINKNDGKIGDDIDDDGDAKAIASKVIVTPRPLKPLQPVQKRATQSLLLRAVAEANQSVVRQKNPEPSLLEKKPNLKRLKPTTVRSSSNRNLAVRLNSNNRLVMENIQVELTTTKSTDKQSEAYVSQTSSDTDDHMGVVMSLFQRGDDNQKFLVTLNGYNNNITKDKNLSDDEERLEMEVNEDDQMVLSNQRSDKLDFLEGSPEYEEIENLAKNAKCENNENHCNDNITISEEIPRKKRKLSPIIYTRSPSPEKIKESHVSPVSSSVEIKSVVTSVVNDKSTDKCRYWPNCSSGSKCSYFHPAVPCSAFPACKFGEKCAYKHPKCKFGLSCTKLGCIFSHPSQQCKYHPFCTKPGCTYLHPQAAPVVPLEASRSKFTWRRRD